MKIKQLQENLTPASTPSVKTIPPTFGRSDEMLESDCGGTSSGDVGSVAAPMGKMQKRGKGSMLKGIKTSAKFPNSAAVKEGRYDSYQRDYDFSRTGFGKPARQDDEGNSEFDDKMRKQTGMIFYNVTDPDLAQQLGLKQTRTGKWFLRTGNRNAQQAADRAFGQGKVWYPQNESVEEDVESSPVTDLKTWQVVIFNNYYAGKYSDYRGRYYYVLATSPDEAKQVVLNNADGILKDILSMKSHNGKRILPPSKAVAITPGRIGKIEDGTVAGRMSTAGYKKMFGPQGPVMVKLSGGAVQDIQDPVVQGSDLKTVSKADLGQNELNLPSGYGDVVQPQKVGEAGGNVPSGMTWQGGKLQKRPELVAAAKGNRNYQAYLKRKAAKEKAEQPVDEASFDYTMKDLGNDYAGFPSQHSLKHKFLAKIKPEKQQLYKDKMNNTSDWDSLFALFKVAKQRGDIIEQPVDEARTPQDWEVKSAVWGLDKRGVHQEPQNIKSHFVRADRSSRAEEKAKREYEPGRGTWEIHPRGNKQQGVAEGLPKNDKDEFKRQALLVKDRKTGKLYDPNKEFDKKMKSPEVMSQMKRMAAKEGVAEGQRLDPSCWKGYKKQGTKMKGGTRVNNCVKVDEAEVSEDKLANDLYKDFQIFKKGADKDIGGKAKDKEISGKAKDKDIVAKMNEMDGDGAGRDGSNRKSHSTYGSRDKQHASNGPDIHLGSDSTMTKKDIQDRALDTLTKMLSKPENMNVLKRLKTKEEDVSEDWQKTNKHDKTDGMSPKAVKAYRRENPGSKLKTAVTKKPSELKAGSKDANRRKSFCARMSGNKGPMKDEHGKPTPKAKALKRWNC